MCQGIATIIYDGITRSTCPEHLSIKLRIDTGCSECGWGFAGKYGKDNVHFVDSNKKVPIEVDGRTYDKCTIHTRVFLRANGCSECGWGFLSEVKELQVSAA